MLCASLVKIVDGKWQPSPMYVNWDVENEVLMCEPASVETFVHLPEEQQQRMHTKIAQFYMFRKKQEEQLPAIQALQEEDNFSEFVSKGLGEGISIIIILASYDRKVRG
jgi:hypothetical protein